MACFIDRLELKKFCTSTLKSTMGINDDIYLTDSKGTIICYEMRSGYADRVVYDPYYELQPNRTDLLGYFSWSIFWDRCEQSDQEIDPYDLANFPVFTFETFNALIKSMKNEKWIQDIISKHGEDILEKY